MKNAWRTMALAAPLALAVACTSEAKAPAEAALAAAATAIDSLKGDAATFAPDAVKSLRSSYATARDSMANKDYQGVLTFAKDIPAKASEVIAKVEAEKTARAKAWSESRDGMTRTLDAARSRIATLSHEKKLPPGIDRASLAKAHADLAELESGWASASAQNQAGDTAGATAKAKDLDAKGQALLLALGVR